MAKKEGTFLRIDGSITKEFKAICKKNNKEYSTIVEEMMKEYIIRDGQILVDDLYADRIGESVKRAVDDQVNRIAKMLYNINVDITAVLNSVPAIHKKDLKALEDTLETYINPQLLNPNRTSQSALFSFDQQGQAMIQNLRKFGHSDIQKRRQLKEETV